jgi:filamentous hemagglutinin family protein
MSFSNKKLNLAIITTLAIILGSFSFGYCLPEGESVEGTVDPSAVNFDRSVPNTLTVSTSLDKLILNFQSFNIEPTETVNFIQQFSTDSILNRVLGNEISNIFGNLFATGNIILINPNGINIGSGANINVASLIASTLDISNQDFLKGNYNFFKNGESAFLINQGNIIIRNGGYVCLLSQAIENQGLIQADLGTVVLASGEKMTLALDDLNDISVVIDEGVKEVVLGPDGKKIDSAIKNTGTISANGGKVILTAKVLNKVFDYAINNEGVVEAKKLVSSNGVVELIAEGAPIYNIGKIEAGEVKVSAPGTNFINKGIIISNGIPELPNGGRISIEAGTILQQGLISANALEGGTAGEVTLVSETSTVLDENSATEAKALGIVGNGGKIRIDSTGGNTVVNKGAVIDVSAGAIAGNAGYIEVSAFDQLGFYGVLNGRAPPGYNVATVLFDPTNIIIQSDGAFS